MVPEVKDTLVEQAKEEVDVVMEQLLDGLING